RYSNARKFATAPKSIGAFLANGWGKHGLRLGTKYKRVVALEEIQRLFPETIAHEIDSSAFRLVEGKGEHTIDFLERRRHPEALKQTEQHLSIRSVGKICARVREFDRERGKAINLSAEYKRVPGHQIDARLMAAFEIDDCKPQMSERDACFNVDAGLIRSAVRDRREHPVQHRRVCDGWAS